ncbi:MAG TPA: hypothetical protein VMP01_27025 [Pirellulaceae bacterium]|nr:hypothetical protein [Pirellulaceae bacterium]
MAANRTSLIVPVLLIAVGIGWLMATIGVAPNILWVWTLSLGAIGVLTFLVWGFDKVTIVIGPLFLLASIMSVLRQTERITLNAEIPLLIIAAGVLSLVAHMQMVPVPAWLLLEQTGKMPGK